MADPLEELHDVPNDAYQFKTLGTIKLAADYRGKDEKEKKDKGPFFKGLRFGKSFMAVSNIYGYVYVLDPEGGHLLYAKTQDVLKPLDDLQTDAKHEVDEKEMKIFQRKTGIQGLILHLALSGNELILGILTQQTIYLFDTCSLVTKAQDKAMALTKKTFQTTQMIDFCWNPVKAPNGFPPPSDFVTLSYDGVELNSMRWTPGTEKPEEKFTCVSSLGSYALAPVTGISWSESGLIVVGHKDGSIGLLKSDTLERIKLIPACPVAAATRMEAHFVSTFDRSMIVVGYRQPSKPVEGGPQLLDPSKVLITAYDQTKNTWRNFGDPTHDENLLNDPGEAHFTRIHHYSLACIPQWRLGALTSMKGSDIAVFGIDLPPCDKPTGELSVYFLEDQCRPAVPMDQVSFDTPYAIGTCIDFTNTVKIVESAEAGGDQDDGDAKEGQEKPEIKSSGPFPVMFLLTTDGKLICYTVQVKGLDRAPFMLHPLKAFPEQRAPFNLPPATGIGAATEKPKAPAKEAKAPAKDAKAAGAVVPAAVAPNLKPKLSQAQAGQAQTTPAPVVGSKESFGTITHGSDKSATQPAVVAPAAVEGDQAGDRKFSFNLPVGGNGPEEALPAAVVAARPVVAAVAADDKGAFITPKPVPRLTPAPLAIPEGKARISPAVQPIIQPLAEPLLVTPAQPPPPQPQPVPVMPTHPSPAVVQPAVPPRKTFIDYSAQLNKVEAEAQEREAKEKPPSSRVTQPPKQSGMTAKDFEEKRERDHQNEQNFLEALAEVSKNMADLGELRAQSAAIINSVLTNANDRLFDRKRARTLCAKTRVLVDKCIEVNNSTEYQTRIADHVRAQHADNMRQAEVAAKLQAKNADPAHLEMLAKLPLDQSAERLHKRIQSSSKRLEASMEELDAHLRQMWSELNQKPSPGKPKSSTNVQSIYSMLNRSVSVLDAERRRSQTLARTLAEVEALSSRSAAPVSLNTSHSLSPAQQRLLALSERQQQSQQRRALTSSSADVTALTVNTSTSSTALTKTPRDKGRVPDGLEAFDKLAITPSWTRSPKDKPGVDMAQLTKAFASKLSTRKWDAEAKRESDARESPSASKAAITPQKNLRDMIAKADHKDFSPNSFIPRPVHGQVSQLAQQPTVQANVPHYVANPPNLPPPRAQTPSQEADLLQAPPNLLRVKSRIQTWSRDGRARIADDVRDRSPMPLRAQAGDGKEASKDVKSPQKSGDKGASDKETKAALGAVSAAAAKLFGDGGFKFDSLDGGKEKPKKDDSKRSSSSAVQAASAKVLGAKTAEPNPEEEAEEYEGDEGDEQEQQEGAEREGEEGPQEEGARKEGETPKKASEKPKSAAAAKHPSKEAPKEAPLAFNVDAFKIGGGDASKPFDFSAPSKPFDFGSLFSDASDNKAPETKAGDKSPAKKSDKKDGKDPKKTADPSSADPTKTFGFDPASLFKTEAGDGKSLFKLDLSSSSSSTTPSADLFKITNTPTAAQDPANLFNFNQNSNSNQGNNSNSSNQNNNSGQNNGSNNLWNAASNVNFSGNSGNNPFADSGNNSSGNIFGTGNNGGNQGGSGDPFANMFAGGNPGGAMFGQSSMLANPLMGMGGPGAMNFQMPGQFNMPMGGNNNQPQNNNNNNMNMGMNMNMPVFGGGQGGGGFGAVGNQGGGGNMNFGGFDVPNNNNNNNNGNQGGGWMNNFNPTGNSAPQFQNFRP